DYYCTLYMGGGIWLF
nr:immunoglobulin light chain junction region [Macaca mulatta]MOW28703.1 immunoglobulin light chain junction region [Macaca mulatta]MOW30413.1 immunoglobulin light chain junction region [Macaca mulatta]